MSKKCYMAWVYGRDEKLRKLSPFQIAENLKREIASCREWSISPKELIEIISKPGYPELKANGIKILIINYHSECVRTGKDLGETPNLIILTYCYHTCIGEDGLEAKARYRQAILENVINPSTVEIPQTEKGYAKYCDWKVICLGSFQKYFGPDLSRWEYKIRKKYLRDFNLPQKSAKTGN